VKGRGRHGLIDRLHGKNRIRKLKRPHSFIKVVGKGGKSGTNNPGCQMGQVNVGSKVLEEEKTF